MLIKGRGTFRAVGLSAATMAAVAVGSLVAASPASARPIDCSVDVDYVQASNGIVGRGHVYCTKPEHLTVRVYIRREDWYGNTVVASGQGESKGRQGWTHAEAFEPCSDVSTSKKYFTHVYVDDTTYGYPLEVKDVESFSYSGHC
jgi:hypothetical protein